MTNLKFRRQFLLSPKKCEQLTDWRCESYGVYNLYIHNDCGCTLSNSPSLHLALIGYIIDPMHPEKSDQDILDDIANCPNINDISDKLYNYGGRFVLIIRQSEEYIIFHDACGLRSVYYTKFGNEIYVASQPLLFKLLIPLKEGAKHDSYYKSKYVKSENEHWIPSGSSLYDNVYHLVPNHYLKFSTFNQVRYWPSKELNSLTFEDGVRVASLLMHKIMIAVSQRFKLALPVTAGWDSRAILSACKPIAADIYFYTLQYRDLTSSSNDIRIPGQILTYLGFEHHIIDCRKPIDKVFTELYLKNTDIHHLNDWGFIAHGMLAEYPSERVTIKGTCAEIGRCYYYSSGKHNDISYGEQLDFLKDWNDIAFIKDQVSDWLAEVTDAKVKKGYDLLDLFYWEHRMGSWQSQSQLEWDIIQEAFTPFNNRALLDSILAVDPRYRCEPDYLFFRALIKDLWKETLIAPINPKSGMQKMKYVIKKALKKLDFSKFKRK